MQYCSDTTETHCKQRRHEACVQACFDVNKHIEEKKKKEREEEDEFYKFLNPTFERERKSLVEIRSRWDLVSKHGPIRGAKVGRGGGGDFFHDQLVPVGST